MIKLSSAMSRLGTETAFDVLARAAALQNSGKPVINLGIGQPDFKTPGHIVEAAVRALHDGHHGYTPANGIPELRRSVAGYVNRRFDVDISPDRVIVEPGGKMTMFFAMLMFGEPGTEIIYPDPGFPIYRSMIEFTGAKAVPLPLLEENGFGFKAQHVLSRITPHTRLIIINSPANPTGGVTSVAEMDRLADGLADHPDVAILSDEIYSRMLYDGEAHRSILSYPRLADRAILLDGWSKTYAMTGWRLGFGIWPEKLVESAVRLGINSHSCVNASAQYAAIAALEGPQDAVADMVAAFDERRRFVTDRLNSLPGVRCATPKGAFYAFPNIEGTGMDERTLQNRLLEEAFVATVAGTSFGQYGKGFLRLSYANSLENIAEALDRMENLLKH